MVTRAQRQLLAAGAMNETGRDGLDANIRAEAKYLDLIAHHNPDSRKATGNGWPDWALLGTRGFLLVEGKSQTGRLSPAQVEVIRRFAALGITVHVWRPADWLEGTPKRMMREIA